LLIFNDLMSAKKKQKQNSKFNSSSTIWFHVHFLTDTLEKDFHFHWLSKHFIQSFKTCFFTVANSLKRFFLANMQAFDFIFDLLVIWYEYVNYSFLWSNSLFTSCSWPRVFQVHRVLIFGEDLISIFSRMLLAPTPKRVRCE
jgi:hypothetical protein